MSALIDNIITRAVARHEKLSKLSIDETYFYMKELVDKDGCTDSILLLSAIDNIVFKYGCYDFSLIKLCLGNDYCSFLNMYDSLIKKHYP